MDKVGRFERMGYRFEGTGAVEICRWTKNALKGRGACYKQKFYGVPAHRCMEFTPSALFCNNNCIYCWRPAEFMTPPGDVEWTPPARMVESLVEKRKKLLSGFGGNERVDPRLFRDSLEPAHFAISLSGEPASYPHLSELVAHLKERGAFSIFLVTNGQYPQALERLDPLPTQLYLSLTAPTPELYRKISVPAGRDAWGKLLHSCDFLSRAATRTVARVTLIRGVNMVEPERWRELLARCNAHFIEFKGYSWIGMSKRRLSLENVPSLEEVREFAESSVPEGYEYMDFDEKSRIVVYRNSRRVVPRFIGQEL